MTLEALDTTRLAWPALKARCVAGKSNSILASQFASTARLMALFLGSPASKKRFVALLSPSETWITSAILPAAKYRGLFPFFNSCPQEKSSAEPSSVGSSDLLGFQSSWNCGAKGETLGRRLTARQTSSDCRSTLAYTET